MENLGIVMGKRRAFTLIELLVVIAIIALLMAILMPALRRVKEQARTVVCRSNLQQWSLCLTMYTSDYDGRFMPGIDEDWPTGKYSWIYTLIPYYNDPAIRLCPKVKRTIEQGGSLPFNAWDVSLTNPADFSYLKEPIYKIGSYGINWWINDSDLVTGAHDVNNKWRRTGQKNQGNIPVLMRIPAHIHFCSYEPLLEDIVIGSCVDWVIVGAESGPKRRPCKIEWVRSVVEQCKNSGVRVFVKQLHINGRVSKNPEEWLEELRFRQLPK